jgi:hypothetical protein
MLNFTSNTPDPQVADAMPAHLTSRALPEGAQRL